MMQYSHPFIGGKIYKAKYFLNFIFTFASNRLPAKPGAGGRCQQK